MTGVAFSTPTACASAQAAIDGSHHRLRWTLFNKLRETTSVLADGSSCTFADVAQLAEHDHAMRHGGRGHEFETRHPLHFGCVLALRGHTTWCWWSGMCAVIGQFTCSETPRPTGRSRSGTAEVDSPALVAQQAEQPPCKRQAAGSNPVTSTNADAPLTQWPECRPV